MRRPDRIALHGAASAAGAPLATAISRRRALSLLGSTLTTLAMAPEAVAQRPSGATGAVTVLPRAPRDDSFDMLHGVRIEDPFRPLETGKRADVQAWIDAVDGEARTVLDGTPLHGKIVEFLRASGRYRKQFGTRRLGANTVSVVHDGLKEQAWLELSALQGGGENRTFLDPNTMGPNGSVNLWGIVPDRLSQKVAYLTAENGGDEQTLRIRDMRTGLDLLDRLEGCRFTSLARLPDGTSFYYTRPPLASEPETLDRTSHHIYQHQLGYPQSADRMLWRFPRRQNVFMTLRASYPTNQLMVTARIGTDQKAGFWVGPLLDATLLTLLVPMGRSSFWPIRNNGAVHFAVTDLDAPRGRIVRLIQGDPRPGGWQTIVPESDGVIDGATLVGANLVVRRFKDLGHKLAIYDLEGKLQADVPVDQASRIEFQRGERVANTLHIDIDDRRRPRRQMQLNVLKGQLEPISGPKPPHTLEDVEIRESKARSKDGTEVPVTVMHLPGLKADGANRTLLYGYGSYGISQWPVYSSLVAAWIRLGGVYAVASIRGGAEFGQTWHENGRLSKKQNALDDFAAAAEHLAVEGICKPERLGIYGGSSGGRLVLGSLVQRPELFGAVVAGVPVADMLRFHRHTFGVAWTQEYGNPDKPEDFAWLRALSPLHNIKSGVTYPPLMILTADNDQRVIPGHAYKFAATLSEASPTSEVHVRTRRGAGHGGGNAYSKGLEYQADILTFLTQKLGGPVLELPKIDT